MLARLRKRNSLTVEVLFKGWNTISVVKASSRKKRELGLFCFVSGQGSSGSKVYNGMNITMGDLVVVCEWILSSLHAGSQMRRTLSITDNQQQDPQARLLK